MSDAERLAAAFDGAGKLSDLNQRPATVDDAYGLQDQVRALIGKRIIGWKVAQTTPKAQAAAGIVAPTVAPLLEGMIVPEGTVFAAARFYQPEGEAEVAIELERDLNPGATRGELADAAAGYRLAIEVADTRYVDKKAMGTPSVIADMNSSAALVVGPLEPLAGLDAVATSQIILRLGDGTIVETLANDMRPDPLTVLHFLNDFVAARGERLRAGQIITTGTHTAPTRSEPGLLVADYVNNTRLTARLSEAAE